MDSSGIYALTESTIVRVALEGGSPVTLGSSSPPRNLVSMIVTPDQIVWTSATTLGSSATDDSVYAIAKTGGATQLIGASQGFVHDLSADDAEIYWISDEQAGSVHQSSIRAAPKAGGTVRTLISYPMRYIWSLAASGPRVQWLEVADNAFNLQLASAAKDATDVRALMETPCGENVVRFTADSLLCGFGRSVARFDLTTGATTALGSYPEVLRWLGADAQGAFLLTYGESRDAEGHLVSTSSSLFDLSRRNQIAHAQFESRVAALDSRYLYWAPLDRLNPGLFRVHR